MEKVKRNDNYKIAPMFVYKNSSNSISVWLDEKVNDSSIPNKYEITQYTLDSYKTEFNDINKYYTKDDDDFESNSLDYLLLTKDKSLLNHVDTYEEGNILIAPNTNRYHCNQLFKKMIDYSIKNKLEYKIKKSNDYLELIGPEFKENFYKFCYENSYIKRKYLK